MAFAERLRRALWPLLVLAVNLTVVWRLFRNEYIDQMPSIGGAFLSLAVYIRAHWPAYDWFPVWYGGFPFSNAYQPLFHYTVAAAAALSGLSTAHAFHSIAGIAYAFGGLAFYSLARAFQRTRPASAAGALVFSLFSPSLLFLSSARADAGGVWHARRLQAMAVYGEMPNIAGLTMGMFALGLLVRALDSPRGPRWLFAALVLAAVPATNWPATVSLLLAIFCLLASMTLEELRLRLPRLLAIGLLAAGLALPFALPSTIAATFHNANRMGDGPTPGSSRWAALALILLACALVRVLSRKRFPALRFASLYSTLFCGIVAAAVNGIRVIPQAFRFHVPMEIALVLLATLAVSAIPLKRSPLLAVSAALTIFLGIQLYHYMRYARALLRPLPIERTIEHEEAQWFDSNMRDARVLAPGSVSFWMNSWTETPQMAGCCEQSLLSNQDFIEAYVTGAGFQDDTQSADYSTLWMKAWAVNAVAIPGAGSRESFRTVLFPSRFEGRLPLLWRDGGDSIYRVPERTPGLARVIPVARIVAHPPANGIDVSELRPFVEALDDTSLPVATWHWKDANDGIARARMTPDQAFSISINYHPGWSAFAAGRPVPVASDGLGLLVVRPGCNGDCQVDLHWSPGLEPVIACTIAAAALAIGIALSVRKASV